MTNGDNDDNEDNDASTEGHLQNDHVTNADNDDNNDNMQKDVDRERMQVG